MLCTSGEGCFLQGHDYELGFAGKMVAGVARRVRSDQILCFMPQFSPKATGVTATQAGVGQTATLTITSVNPIPA